MPKKANSTNKVSYQTEVEAMKLAKANQKPGQTKEQTKLVAQGIQKGIEQYKKQHKEKLRALDKERKKLQAKYQKDNAEEICSNIDRKAEESFSPKLPWTLLTLSWMSFLGYLLFFK